MEKKVKKSMSIKTVKSIIENTFQIDFDESVNTYEKIENSLKMNMDVIAGEKKKIVYKSKGKYTLTFVFEIETITKGKIKDMHNSLRLSSENHYKEVKAEEDIQEVKKELGIHNNYIKDVYGIVKYYLHDAFEYFKIDDIDEKEYKWLELVGMKAKLYSAKCSFIDFYDYDVNSMYPYIMAVSKVFKFPVGSGREIQIDSIDDIDVKQLGIYKLNILSKVDERIFMKNDAYTNYDIQFMNKLGYKYKLASNTAYVYDKCMNSYKFFGYLKDLYYMRKTSKYPKIIKDIMVITHGMCAKRNKTEIKKVDFLNMTDEEIEGAIRNEMGNNKFKIDEIDYAEGTMTLINESEKPFKFGGLARIEYFLTSYGRMHIGKMLTMNEDIKKSLVYVHTDGFRCKVPPEEMKFMGDDIGLLKCVKLDGKFRINHLNSMYYYDEIEKEWVSYKKEKFENYKKNKNI